MVIDPPRLQKIFLTSREAAEFFMLSPSTLHGYGVKGEGPVFHRSGGKMVYSLPDLKVWAMTRQQKGTA